MSDLIEQAKAKLKDNLIQSDRQTGWTELRYGKLTQGDGTGSFIPTTVSYPREVWLRDENNNPFKVVLPPSIQIPYRDDSSIEDITVQYGKPPKSDTLTIHNIFTNDGLQAMGSQSPTEQLINNLYLAQFILKTASTDYPNAQSLGSLGSNGLLYNNIALGVTGTLINIPDGTPGLPLVAGLTAPSYAVLGTLGGGSGIDSSATGPGYWQQSTNGANVTILKHNLTATVAPAVTDDGANGYAIGSQWVDTIGKKAYVLVDASPGAAVWHPIIAIGALPSTDKAITTWNGTSGDKLNDNPNATIDTNGNLTANEYKLHAGVTTTLASDAFTVTSGFHILEAQTGTTDNLATINGGSGVQELTIQADADDTIIVKTGADNIFLNGGTDFSLSGNKTLRLFRNDVTTNWSDIGAGGGSAFYQTVQDTGVDQTQRSKLDFVGATVTDDAGNDRTIVTLAGGGSGITKTVKTFYQRTVLYDNTLGSAGVWDVSSIDQTYDHLEIIIVGKATEAVANENVNISFNNDTTDSNYLLDQFFELNAVAGASTNLGNRLEALTIGSSGDSNKFATYLGTLLDYTNTSFHKLLQGQSSVHNASGSSSFILSRIMTWKNTTAINRITIEVANATNTFVTGSRLQIIGIKQEDVVTDVSGTGTVQFTQTATVTVSNTTTETTLVGSGVGSTTFAANALNAVGRTVRLKMWGILSDLGALPGNLTIKLKLGSTVLVTSGAVALVAGLTNALWELEFAATVRTTGATGTIMTNGVMRIVSALADTVEPLTNGTSTITIDFTGSLVTDVTCTFSTASASNAITSLNGVLEVLN